MLRLISIVLLGSCTALAHAAPIVFSASGPDAAAIFPTVDSFRSALGTLNANVPVSFGTGRREINWDGVPAAFAAPNNLPANFFNVNSPRGVVLGTPGSGFQVSGATTDNLAGQPAAANFGNINAAYATGFATFSAQRLFTALGSNVTDVSFFIPGTTTPAFTSAFGAVFTDVDLANTTSLQFFDLANASLGTFFVPSASGNATLSFLGVQFNAGEKLGRVRIISGNTALGPNDGGGVDAVAMDDFIFAEPRTVAEPASLGLFMLGLLLIAGFTRDAAHRVSPSQPARRTR